MGDGDCDEVIPELSCVHRSKRTQIVVWRDRALLWEKKWGWNRRRGELAGLTGISNFGRNTTLKNRLLFPSSAHIKSWKQRQVSDEKPYPEPEVSGEMTNAGPEKGKRQGEAVMMLCSKWASTQDWYQQTGKPPWSATRVNPESIKMNPEAEGGAHRLGCRSPTFYPQHCINWMQWCITVISALRQGEGEVQVSQGYVRPCFQQERKEESWEK